jgi:hypothetical protein
MGTIFGLRANDRKAYVVSLQDITTPHAVMFSPIAYCASQTRPGT